MLKYRFSEGKAGIDSGAQTHRVVDHSNGAGDRSNKSNEKDYRKKYLNPGSGSSRGLAGGESAEALGRSVGEEQKTIDFRI